MDALIIKLSKALIITFLFFFEIIPSFGQFHLSGVGGGAYNFANFLRENGTHSPNTYGNAAGGFVGVRSGFCPSKRFALEAELSYHVLPYTIKFYTGQFNQSFLTIGVFPSYALIRKIRLEMGISTGLTVVNRFVDKNDPIFLTSLGILFPINERWGIISRYYTFLKPLYIEEDATGSKSKFSSHGIQLGVKFRLF